MTQTPDRSNASRDGCEAVDSLHGLAPLNMTADEAGGRWIRFHAEPGLYQLSVIIDGSAFDWEQLYFDLELYGNQGQRTGPWDFSLLANRSDPANKNPPLVPSYWASVDDRSLGLWFFQRVSLEDLAQRRFRGRMACYVQRSGEHVLSLAPYRPMRVRWHSVRLERDPEDELTNLPLEPHEVRARLPVSAWRDSEFWDRQRQRLSTADDAYRQPLTEAFDWAMSLESPLPIHLPLLIAAHRLDHRAGALERVLQVIDQAIAQPAWGPQNPEGYGHNGDMEAAEPMRNLAQAYHMLGEVDLGSDRCERLVEKLVYQAGIFFDLMLLNRDYWGGSVLQDHGRRSACLYATAVLHLLGLAPEAERWTSYALPRAIRGVTAMPRDGVIPPSSYGSPAGYLQPMMHMRQTLLAVIGRDIYEEGPFERIVDYISDLWRQDQPVMLLPSTQMPLNAGLTFFNQIIAGDGDRAGVAAHLAERLLRCPPRDRIWQNKPSQINAVYEDYLWALVYDDRGRAKPTPPRRAQAKLSHYEDSGLVHYHDRDHDLTLTLRCGPWCGHHAYRRATGPCDRMNMMPDAGHFVVYRGVTALLANPDSAYRLHTGFRNCLLVDDQGQIGDIGYPMSLPSWRHPGEEILAVNWNERTFEGVIRLDLQPAYPEKIGMARYTRELMVGPEPRIICRDHVVFDRPHQLSWLFHGRRDLGVRLETETRCRFGAQDGLTLTPELPGPPLRAEIKPTPLIYGYTSQRRQFDHVRYDTAQPISAATVDFVMTW